jgi:hypothetical protein
MALPSMKRVLLANKGLRNGGMPARPSCLLVRLERLAVHERRFDSGDVLPKSVVPPLSGLTQVDHSGAGHCHHKRQPKQVSDGESVHGGYFPNGPAAGGVSAFACHATPSRRSSAARAYRDPPGRPGRRWIGPPRASARYGCRHSSGSARQRGGTAFHISF